MRFERHHARRQTLVRGLLEERPDSAFGLVRRLFPHLPDSRVAQALTELIGQLDVLVARSEVMSSPRDGVLVHRLVR